MAADRSGRDHERGVEIQGLREFRRALKELDEKAPAALKAVMNQAAQFVVDDVQRRVPRLRGRAAGSYKAGKGTTATIAYGGRAAPYAPWLDFGGTVGKGHVPGRAYSGSVERTYLGRPYGKGRYLYPAIEENLDDVEPLVVKGLEGIIRTYGLEID